MLVIIGVVVFVNVTPLLGTFLTTTTTGPVPEPAGTGTTMLVPVERVGVAVIPSKVIVLDPCGEPNFVPVTVTTVPAGPVVGERVKMFGVARNVNVLLLLDTPSTVTITGPVVAAAGTGTTICVPYQVCGVAVAPLNVTVLVPCGEPKSVPEIVTNVPTGPDVGESVVMVVYRRRHGCDYC